MTDSRRRALRSRIADAGGIDGWRIALGKAAQSDFLCGRSPKAWSGFSFDWLTASKNFIKIMEGNYDNRTSRPSAPDNPTLQNPNAVAEFWAKHLNDPAARVPQTAISPSLARLMLELRLVTPETLKRRGFAA
jgi:hypothetical protein